MTLLACICLTVLIVKGSIFRGFRATWPALLTCPLCLGFWIGFAGHQHILGPFRAELLCTLHDVQSGAISGVGAYFVFYVLETLESVCRYVDNENATKHGP